MMTDFQYSSYCGLYCGACDVMHQFRKGQQIGKSPEWGDLPLNMQKHIPVPKTSPIICYGCKSDIVFYGCGKCPIRKCAKERDNIENCTECEKYPCLKFRIIKWVWRFGGFYKKLPHLRDVNSNLLEIQNIGIANWLEKQQDEWTCATCHYNLTWYTRDSHDCPK